MIALLEGTALLQPDGLIVMTSGVGYGVAAGGRTLMQIQDGTTVRLWIYTHVREDVLELFGFLTKQDKELFELLLSVSGVGPRTALAISDVGSATIVTAVQTADVSVFSSVPRVGKKLAQKIIIELKSKLGSLQELHLGPRSPVEQDVLEALQTLGFSDSDIARALQGLDTSDQTDSSVLIKQAIQIIGSK